MSDDKYYLAHGLILDIDNGTLEQCEDRAMELMATYGDNCAVIRIGKVKKTRKPNTLVIYFGNQKFVPESK